LPNLFNILRNTSFLAIMACGQMLVMIVGGMDLSVGATAALTSVVAAKVMSSATETYGVRPGAAIALGIVASVGSAAAIGLLNGLCFRATACPRADRNARHAFHRFRDHIHDDQRHSGIRAAATVPH
jgi:ribose/xylose/arabinose/galactoside ABC-type transport system permease subunit